MSYRDKRKQAEYNRMYYEKHKKLKGRERRSEDDYSKVKFKHKANTEQMTQYKSLAIDALKRLQDKWNSMDDSQKEKHKQLFLNAIKAIRIQYKSMGGTLNKEKETSSSSTSSTKESSSSKSGSGSSGKSSTKTESDSEDTLKELLYAKRYYDKNKHKLNEYSRKYYEKNKDVINDKNKNPINEVRSKNLEDMESFLDLSKNDVAELKDNLIASKMGLRLDKALDAATNTGISNGSVNKQIKALLNKI